jgi:hypothetical protein
MTAPGYKSKTLAAWLALIGGVIGLHRFYLEGPGDRLAWLHLPPSGAGLIGVLRMRELGQDDRLSWILIPLLGLMIAQAMLHAIVYGLTADERWDERRNGGRRGPATGWAPVLAVIAALLVGATVLMGTIAFSGQKFFEWQLEDSSGAARRR